MNLIEENKKIEEKTKKIKLEQETNTALFSFSWIKKIREFAKEKKPSNKKVENILTIFVIIVSLSLFVYLLDLNIPAIPKIILIGILLVFSGEILIGLKNLDGEFGLIFFKDKRLIDWIDKVGKKYQELFVFFADIGFIIGYGLAGIYLIKDKKSKVFKIVFGLIIFFLFYSLIMPHTYSALVGSINDSELASASRYLREQNFYDYKIEFFVLENKITISLAMIFYGISICFGIAGAALASLITYSIIVGTALVIKIFELVGGFFGLAIASTNLPPAGGTVLIPGRNLPLLEGIIAFIIILMVHELAHGFLARIYEVKLRSTGIVFFGILPIGAFVEPDEEEMEKIEKYKQNRILVAGSASNIYSGILIFCLFSIIILLTAQYRIEGYYYQKDGQYILINKINSIEVEKFLAEKINLSATKELILSTQNGEIKIEKKVLEYIKRYYKDGYNFKYKYIKEWEFLEFILNTLKLSFALNLIIGSINLLFIPFFDGSKILQNSIENKNIANAIVLINSAAFLINLLPWIFK
ncbi:MAG: site-2 protease family protein [Candidatus Micrarchaeota archaeon]|nr:site-2 protease family protein [Candidatus Micrarchaeota archaeon]